jgi:TonB-dependent SusC/RagA subfamily outer membrane receptor
MRSKILFVILFSVFCFQYSSAQKSKKVTITGTVLGVDKQPIANGIIMIDNIKTSSITNAEGKYSVKVKPDAHKIGVFTFGNGVREEDINGRVKIDFNFSTAAASQPVDEEIEAGDEAVNTGYRVVKRKDVTTDISKIDGTNKKYASYSSIYDMIQREVSGVKVNGDYIIVQGSKTLDGSVPALLVVDGVYVQSIGDISPTSVESVEVLKGSSASMYGSRGFGGVILISTRIKNK